MKQEQEVDRTFPFDPSGLVLVGIVGGAGILLLLKHGWALGAFCAVLAALGFISSHRRFDRASED